MEEETRAAGTPALYYQHEDGLWTMTLNTLKLSDSNKKDEEDEDDEYSYYHRYTTKKKVKTHAWFIVDEFHKERFTHDGDTMSQVLENVGNMSLLLVLHLMTFLTMTTMDRRITTIPILASVGHIVVGSARRPEPTIQLQPQPQQQLLVILIHQMMMNYPGR